MILASLWGRGHWPHLTGEETEDWQIRKKAQTEHLVGGAVFLSRDTLTTLWGICYYPWFTGAGAKTERGSVTYQVPARFAHRRDAVPLSPGRDRTCALLFILLRTSPRWCWRERDHRADTSYPSWVHGSLASPRLATPGYRVKSQQHWSQKGRLVETKSGDKWMVVVLIY